MDIYCFTHERTDNEKSETSFVTVLARLLHIVANKDEPITT